MDMHENPHAELIMQYNQSMYTLIHTQHMNTLTHTKHIIMQVDILAEEDLKILQETVHVKEALSNGKFCGELKSMVCGDFTRAAKGLFALMQANEDEVIQKSLLGVKAIENEVHDLGVQDVMDHLDYILYQ
jgi:hypothetical protein